MTFATRPLLPLWAAIIVAIASGPIMDAGFPARGWWPFTFLGIGLLLSSLIGRRAGSALLVGFVSGLAFYFVHIDWATLFLGWLPMTALSVLESLFVALGAMLISLAYRWCAAAWPTAAGRVGALPLIVAGIWTAREAIDSTWPYGGFAWGRVALSQSESPFRHLFAWLGVSGVTFVMVWLVALAIASVSIVGAPAIMRAALPVSAIALVLAVPAFPIAISGTATIAAVQGNGKAGYFDQRQLGDLLNAQLTATQAVVGHKVDMVVWPEGATDIDPLESGAAAAAFDSVSRTIGAPLIAGAITIRGDNAYNSSLLWKAGKGAVDIYDKKHPVPFGEYVPNRAFWRPFAPDLIDLIGRDYTPGTTDTVFNVDGIIAGIDICFDISDDAVIADSVRDHATVLLAQTNNADFGHTDESVQQLAIARIRALEFGRSVVNISTVGTSAIIAPDGSTIDRLPTFTAAAMIDDVPLSSTTTPAVPLAGPIELFVSWFGLLSLLVARISIAPRRAHRG